MRPLRFAVPIMLGLWLVAIPGRAGELVPFPAQPAGIAFPTQEWPEADPADPRRAQINAILDRAFTGQRTESLARTKAIVVVNGGRLVAERYAEGISRETRLQSWSTAKSFLHAALGAAIAEGKLDPQSPAPAPEWQTNGDARKAITIRQLAQMTSGLAFTESYTDPAGETMQMLFGAGRGDVAHAAASLPSIHQPGTHWFYASGSANILSRVLRDTLGGREAYRAFLQTQLFEPLGMKSAVPEFDASGTWIGSSYVHATARDFARFGLLYLRGGLWDGKQIVPRNWIDIGRTPTLASKGEYGALFWLNAPNPDDGIPATSPHLPVDTFYARGFGGQLIAIVPSRDAVIVMMNAAYTDDASPIVALLADVLKALP
jgi:CubicO group peptidase (beta-lactamase class C family)